MADLSSMICTYLTACFVQRTKCLLAYVELASHADRGTYIDQGLWHCCTGALFHNIIMKVFIWCHEVERLEHVDLNACSQSTPSEPQ